MATIGNNLHLEIAHFQNFSKFIKGFDKCCTNTIEILLQKGLLEISTCFENALADVGKYTVISKNHADLCDGSDAKLTSVRTSSLGKQYSAPVHNIFNKTGKLRVQVYERKQNKFYYFVIPNEAYTHIPKTSNIEILFQLDGTPKKINKAKINFWDFEVKSFTSLATK